MLCMADPDPTDWSHFDPSNFHYQDNYYYPPQYSSFGANNSQSSSNPFDPIQTTTTATPTATATVTSPSGSSSGRRHPVYHGIRYRAGKWVSEIREPRKSNRIWLGTYPTPEMAAAAYDVAALALKGSDASLNFADSVLPNTIPRSPTPADIRVAAANAAAARAPQPEVLFPPPGHDHDYDDVSQQTGGYVDEDELFDMPNLLREMAEGMMLSPPGIPSDDSPEKMDGENFWNYP